MKIREDYTCPLEITHDLIKGKWKPIILWQLSKKNHSLSELKQEIQGISEKMLLEQLAELQAYRFIDKQSFDGYPLKVLYFLKERGQKMLTALTIMQEIGTELLEEIPTKK
ncbi:winged helix-turn-helix transcriptional regulator [Enterococcus sp. AZ163]|uniref:winged helix-turn-helix transcriptional regulator n=1 Tax=Enterococcus sp. AZ163 TaxID=2774638 RepID=UPI003D26A549